MIRTTHNAGFFSCCYIKLYRIINYVQAYRTLPLDVDSSDDFNMYKYNNSDVTFDFFEHYKNINMSMTINTNSPIINWDEQYYNYKNLNYENIGPFVKKYFTPSQNIINNRDKLLLKYNINTYNCVGLYYRGTDKNTETQVDDFESYYNKLNEVIKNNDIQVLIQTDSAQFLNYMKEKNSSIIVINENDTSYTNKGIHNEKKSNENYVDMQNLFATFLIISKCKYIICGSCNGSLWMMYYRLNANNVYQNLNKVWL
jgi:hypothetical protein